MDIRKWISLLVAGLMMWISAVNLVAKAQEHYEVYNYDKWEEAIPSQAGYMAVRSVSGKDLGIGDFSELSDIFRDALNRFFVVDTKNNRIVVINSSMSEVIMIMEKFTMPDGSVTTLKNPEGVYVSPETGFIYIADYDHSRVLVCDEDCQVTMEITKPQTELFSQDLTFLPQKVLADKAGNVYVVLGNITTGAMMFDNQGEFLGYYGANTVEATSEVVANYFWKLISTEEMRSRQARTVPTGITNFDIDEEGFIYTCTQSTSQKKDTVKKLNPAGTNLFADLNTSWGDIQSVYDTNTNKNYQSMICDIEISEDGNIHCLDLTSGRIFQYDKEGNLLFIFGTSSDQLGGFTEVSALESFENQILVLDSRKNTITIFEETDFGETVHRVTKLFHDGYYEEALEPWFEVLQYDGNYQRAFLGISAGYLVQGNYRESMKYAKLADSPYRYNRAFEGYRTEFLNEHRNAVTIIIVLVIAGIFALKKRYKPNREGNHPMMDFTNRQWLKYAVTHPIEGFEDMRWKKAGSMKISCVILLFWLIASIFENRLYGFQFRVTPDKLFNVIPFIVQTVILFLTWVVGNWSVCTLLDGEGRIRNIFIYSAYALIPYVTSLYIEVLLSHFLIQDEIVLIEAVSVIGTLWSGMLIFSAVKSVHQYSFKKTITAILLTIAAMLIMLFLLVLVLALFQQVYLFLYSIYTELAYRFMV